MRNQLLSPAQILEEILSEIAESQSLLEFIIRHNDGSPFTGCALVCLLDSLGIAKEKAHSYTDQLSERSFLHNKSGSTAFAATSSSTPFSPFYYPTTETLGDRIKSMREQRNLGQFYLASSVGVTRSCIEAWEENSTIPASDKTIPLANALNCDPMWLLTGQDNDGQPADALSHASPRQ